jgi:TonB family protein
MEIEVQQERRQVSPMFSSPKRSALLSGCIHAAAIVLAVAVSRVVPSALPTATPTAAVQIYVGKYLPDVRSAGGGGGGARDPNRASKGPLPRRATHQFDPPRVVSTNLMPRLAIEPTIIGVPEPVRAMPTVAYGDPNGVDGPPSDGPGKNGGIGDGDGGGVGNRKGPGAGPDGDNFGVSGPGGRIRRSLTPPVPLVKIDPEYSEEARRARIQGVVLLSIEVDTNGEVRHISVQRSLGLGLDEKAIEAVKRWKFRPGTIDGKPAVISAVVEVNFRLL